MSFDLLDSKKHLMVIYDDLAIGRKIEFEFIKEGLDKNELSVYLIHGDVKQIEKDMQSFGIDVNYYKKKGLLKVEYLGNPAEESLDFMDVMQAKIQVILPSTDTPFRIVGRAIPDVGTEVAISIQSRWEKILHTALFDKFNGSILCTYDLSQILANNEWSRWLKELKENHHAYMICQNGKCSLSTNY